MLSRTSRDREPAADLAAAPARLPRTHGEHGAIDDEDLVDRDLDLAPQALAEREEVVAAGEAEGTPREHGLLVVVGVEDEGARTLDAEELDLGRMDDEGEARGRDRDPARRVLGVERAGAVVGVVREAELVEEDRGEGLRLRDLGPDDRSLALRGPDEVLVAELVLDPPRVEERRARAPVLDVREPPLVGQRGEDDRARIELAAGAADLLDLRGPQEARDVGTGEEALVLEGREVDRVVVVVGIGPRDGGLEDPLVEGRRDDLGLEDVAEDAEGLLGGMGHGRDGEDRAVLAEGQDPEGESHDRGHLGEERLVGHGLVEERALPLVGHGAGSFLRSSSQAVATLAGTSRVMQRKSTGHFSRWQGQQSTSSQRTLRAGWS